MIALSEHSTINRKMSIYALINPYSIINMCSEKFLNRFLIQSTGN